MYDMLKATSECLPSHFFSPLSVCSDNILVLDIYFEALNYETIEQKKAYELAGLLGKEMTVKCFSWVKITCSV